MLYSFENKTPKFLGNNIFISDQSCVIGEVIFEDNVCVLPQAVIRADNDEIRICNGSNIQDGAVIHTDVGIKMKIGRNVTIAHRATIHGCNIGDNTLVGIGAIILNNSNIGKNCIIGAGTLILENTNIPDGCLVIGSPSKIKKQLDENEIQNLKIFSQHYINKIPKFTKKLIPIPN